MSKLKAYILNRFAHSNINYSSWMADCPYDCQVIDDFVTDWVVPDDAGIVITHMHYRWEEISVLRRIYEAHRVPILILADGILEFRNTWQNPRVADGSVFQPLFGHKLACIGRTQARVIESWGNAGKCEVVGLPKFDEVQNNEHLPVQIEGPFRVLVATANTPAFTPTQREKVVESLRLIHSRIQKNPWVNDRPLEISWRLADGLMHEIGIAEFQNKTQKPIPIGDAIELADAVITTPSTLYLESVMKRRPTAILDFTNSPMYTQSAWSITAPAHLNDVLCELENPEPAKMLFQRSVLHDNLELGNSSKSRLFSLIKSMVKLGADARTRKRPITMPARLVCDPQRGIQQVEAEFDLTTLYPENPHFEITDVHRLQQELNQAIERLGQMPRDLDTKHAGNQKLSDQLAQAERRISDGLERDANHLKMIETKNKVIAKKMEHITSLEAHFRESNVARKEARMEVVRLKKELRASNAKLVTQLARKKTPVPIKKPAPVKRPAPTVQPVVVKQPVIGKQPVMVKQSALVKQPAVVKQPVLAQQANAVQPETVAANLIEPTVDSPAKKAA